jgi:MFS family permease
MGIDILILGRSLQGVAGGGLLQIVTIIISDLFSVRYDTTIGCIEIYN